MEEIEELLKYFSCEHLSDHVKPVSAPFVQLADDLANRFLSGHANAGQTVKSLEWLLMAKDCAVRAAL